MITSVCQTSRVVKGLGHFDIRFISRGFYFRSEKGGRIYKEKRAVGNDRLDGRLTPKCRYPSDMRKVSRWTSSDESMPGYRLEIIPNLATARAPKDENSTAQKQLSRLLPGWGTSAGPDEMSQPRNEPTNQPRRCPMLRPGESGGTGTGALGLATRVQKYNRSNANHDDGSHESKMTKDGLSSLRGDSPDSPNRARRATWLPCRR